ncbi:hypothetical protein JEQ12_011352 [Ovis aries]|uniref:FAS-associated death domain protein n=1 Tax=Ovis aries TaxID=9940 RepID=A0A835ZRV2_SHEEP|nr:hypothetical protein JEQ12_011352 [Ovis aries]
MDPFLVLLHSVSVGLSSSDLTQLKFLCRNRVSKRKLELAQSGLDLFTVLLEQNELSAERTALLRELLGPLRREDLLCLLDDFERGAEAGAAPEERDLRAAMEIICDNVGKDWKRLARRLRVSEIKIEAIEEKYPRNLVEQVSTRYGPGCHRDHGGHQGLFPLRLHHSRKRPLGPSNLILVGELDPTGGKKMAEPVCHSEDLAQPNKTEEGTQNVLRDGGADPKVQGALSTYPRVSSLSLKQECTENKLNSGMASPSGTRRNFHAAKPGKEKSCVPILPSVEAQTSQCREL